MNQNFEKFINNNPQILKENEDKKIKIYVASDKNYYF